MDMIQDIAPHRYDNSYREMEAREGDFGCFIRESQIFLVSDGETDEGKVSYRFPLMGELEAVFPGAREHAVYLFSIDDRAYFLITEPEGESFCESEAVELAERVTRRSAAFCGTGYLRTMEPMYQAFAGVTALQLYRFRESRKFCGACGSRTVHSRTERAYVCPNCGQTEYPKISPAVIVAITNGDKLLMSRYRDRPYRGYALIAGFVEIGETFEETVRREVMEEVGLKVKNIRYMKSQPWGFTDSEMIGFFAELDGDDTIRLEEDELAEAAWYAKEEIPDDDSRISIGSEMKMAFKYGKI